ncbi:MAG: hypothetical protein KDJ68_11630 [Rhodobiaceae bacterium]|nr:hypothetical protein [Paracoccaceae bacterium]MCB1473500.1 hypothetical protein [Rhodobiaceae bacterium]
MRKWLAGLVAVAVVAGAAGVLLIGGRLDSTFDSIDSPPDQSAADGEGRPGERPPVEYPPSEPTDDVPPGGGSSLPDTGTDEGSRDGAAPGGRTPASQVSDEELALWVSALDTDDPAAFESYLREFPGGQFAPLAKKLLEQLRAQGAGSGAVPGMPLPGLGIPGEGPLVPTLPEPPGWMADVPMGGGGAGPMEPYVDPNPPPSRTSADDKDEGFPWPPPRASARHVIRLDEIPGIVAGEATLGDIAAGIVGALERAGYFDRSYFELDVGAAIVTRLERIRANGYPEAGDARWPLSVSDTREFSLARMLKSLFFAEPGHFRVIAFIITDQPFRERVDAPSAGEATRWLSEGYNTLPERAASQRSTKRHVVTALIYEFERAPGEEQAHQLVPGQLQGATHLQRAGIVLESTAR